MFLHNIRRFKDSIISRKAKQLSVKNFGENLQQGQKKGRPVGRPRYCLAALLPPIDITMSRLQCGEGAAPAAADVGGSVAVLVGDGVTAGGQDAEVAEGRGDVGGLRARVAEPVIAGYDGQADIRGWCAAHGETDGSCGLDLIHLSGIDLRQRAAPLATLIAGKASVLRVDEDSVATKSLFELLKRHRLGGGPPVAAGGQGGIDLTVEADVGGDVARGDSQGLVVDTLIETSLEADIDVGGEQVGGRGGWRHWLFALHDGDVVDLKYPLIVAVEVADGDVTRAAVGTQIDGEFLPFAA